jgi:hypothetical protein
VNEDKIWRGLLRAAMGGALGALIFLVFLGLWGNIFHVGTGHDQAYLITFIFFFTPILLLLGAFVGTITGISVWVLARRRQNTPGLVKRLLVGSMFAMLLGALAALYFGEGNKTLEYWVNFTVVVLVFGIAVGGVAGAFAGKRRA